MAIYAFQRFIIKPSFCVGNLVAAIAVKEVSYLFILLSLSLPCSYAIADSDPDAETSDLKTVKVQLKWRHQFQFAGYYMAKELGYYQKAGLDVQLIERGSQGEATSIDKLMGGRVDFAVTDSGALLYRSTGAPLVALAAIFQHSPSIVITRKDIEQLHDLDGKKVMMSGGYMNAELITMLQKVGLSIDDVDVIPTIASVNSLIDGTTDAYNGYTVNEPYVLKEHGLEFNSFRPKDFGVDFYGDILTTTEGLIEQDPDMVDAFLEASLKGWKYAVNNQEEAVNVIIEKYNTQKKSRNHLLFEAKEASKLVFSEIVPIGYMNVERWQRIETIFRQQQLLNGPVNYDNFIYSNRVPNHMMDALYEYRLQIASGLILAFGGLILLHNVHLRRQVVLRTQELDESLLQAEVEARTDWLTGLPNRRQFFESVKYYIGQAERRGVNLAMISLDLDHFKKINDTYGHDAGDEALIQTANLLSQHVRKDDVVARLGGEEFSIACLDTNHSNVLLLAERIREAVLSSEISSGSQRFSCTASIGIAFWEQEDSFDRLLKKADQAMYEAKAKGRNRVSVWTPSAMIR